MNSSGKCEEAIKHLKSAVEMMKKLKLTGPDREKLAMVLYNLGLAYEIYPDNQKALQVISFITMSRHNLCTGKLSKFKLIALVIFRCIKKL